MLDFAGEAGCMAVFFYARLWNAGSGRCTFFYDYIMLHDVVLQISSVGRVDSILRVWSDGRVDWNVCGLGGAKHCVRLEI